MKMLRVHRVDAFADNAFGGNPAGVVLDAEDLTEREMRFVAKEMSVSETVFVLSSKRADLRLRFFTQAGDEIKFCGHATVAVLYLIAREQLLGVAGPGIYSLTVETKDDDLCMSVDFRTLNDIRIHFQCPPVALQPVDFSCQDLADGLGVDICHLYSRNSILMDTEQRYLYASVRSLDDLGSLDYDQNLAIEFCKKHDIVVLCFLTAETFDPNNDVHARCFGPVVGVEEDAFSGSTQGGLIYYLLKNDMLLDMNEVVKSEQGHFMHRPGVASIHLDHVSEKQVSVTVDATARHVLSTVLTLNEEDISV